VVWPAVQFDGELELGPVAVDLPAVDEYVASRLGDLGVLGEKRVEVLLEIGVR
jgi:hypothetical protein